VAGNRTVGRLVDRRGAVPTLLAGSTGVAAASGVLMLFQLWYPAILVAVLAIGFFSGLTITPQQHRFFSLMPDVAAIALGLTGSAIYVGSAVGAALGGIVAATAEAAGSRSPPRSSARWPAQPSGLSPRNDDDSGIIFRALPDSAVRDSPAGGTVPVVEPAPSRAEPLAEVAAVCGRSGAVMAGVRRSTRARAPRVLRRRVGRCR
jgi:MFS family permease